MKRVSLGFLSILILLSVHLTFAQDEIPALPGQIAYIGNDRNVRLLNFAGSEHIALTEDAAISQQELVFYQWPTWARDGRLAYFRSSISGTGDLGLDVYVLRDSSVPQEPVYSSVNESLTYTSWAPQNCLVDSQCRDLAMLIAAPNQGEFSVTVVRDSEEPSEFIAGTGAPFYFSWSPDASRMAWHRNAELLETYGLSEGDVISTLDRTAGNFYAPAWSPVDDRVLFGAQNADGNTDLIIHTSELTQTVISDLVGSISFAWSPDGNAIALLNQAGPLQVIDPTTETLLAETPNGDILAYFWAPNSAHIAYVTADTPDAGSFSAKPAQMLQSVPGLVWWILDIETGEVRRYGSFFPTREMAYLLSYYDQFAQSHQIWSPDSQHIVYSETLQNGESVINVLAVTQTAALPLVVAEGIIGIWSYN